MLDACLSFVTAWCQLGIKQTSTTFCCRATNYKIWKHVTFKLANILCKVHL